MESLLAAEVVDIVCLLLMMKTCFVSGRHENLSFYFCIYYFPFFQALFLILLLKKRKKNIHALQNKGGTPEWIPLRKCNPLFTCTKFLWLDNFRGTHTKEGFAVIGSVADDVSRKKHLMSISSNLFRSTKDEKTP